MTASCTCRFTSMALGSRRQGNARQPPKLVKSAFHCQTTTASWILSTLSTSSYKSFLTVTNANLSSPVLTHTVVPGLAGSISQYSPFPSNMCRNLVSQRQEQYSFDRLI